MNKKLAIIGFVSIWVAAVIAIIIIIWPMVVSIIDQKKELKSNEDKNYYGVNNNSLINNQNRKDDFFYEKKVFIRHYRNEYDSEVVVAATPIRRIVLPKPITNKPIIRPQSKKQNTGGFDIKPVPVQ